MAEDYWNWYANAFGPLGSGQQGPAPGPAALSPRQWDAFYRSVGIEPQAPATRVVQSVPVDMPPLPRPAPERATTVAAYSTKPRTAGMSYAGTERFPPAPAYIPERLMPGSGLPANYGTMTPQQVAQIGVGLGNEVNAQGQRVTVPNPLQIVVDGANPIQTAQAKIAPTPFPPFRAVGSQVDAMPPMPIARPGRPVLPIGASISPSRVAPSPVSRPGRLAIGAMPSQGSPLRITVSGANPVRPSNSVLDAARAVIQSGDTSSGNQFEMANLIASGNSWRESQARKK